MSKKPLKEPLTKYKIKPTIFNYLTIEWLTPLMFKGAFKALEVDDLYDLNDRDTANNLSHVLDSFWIKFHQANPIKSSSHKPPNLFWNFFTKFYKLFTLAVICQGISIACALAVPKFIQQVIFYFIPLYPRSLLWIQNGYYLALAIFALQFGTSLFGRTAEQIIRTMEQNVRTVLIGSIYEKSLRLSLKSSNEFNQGRILNLINVDSEKIALSLTGVNGLWSTPVQIAVALYQLQDLLGVATWAGAGTLFGVLFLQVAVVFAFVAYQKAFLKAGDERLKATREMLYGIKIIKFRALEEFFEARITKIRSIQLKALKGYFGIQVIFVAFLQITPVAMPIVAFITYSALNNGVLTPQIIFPALALFNLLFQPLLILPTSITQLVVAVVSWNRVREYLFADEMVSATNVSKVSKDFPIVVDDATFQWDSSSKVNEAKQKDEEKESIVQSEFKLNKISLKVKNGELIAIVGAVGAGKSSILSSIIGEMPNVSGDVSINGTLAYCAQQPWIMTDTIRGNILFGDKLDEDKFERIVQACALNNDISQFSAGDMTQIGEKGVNLSGGQKARVALARAMYQNSDIYLLDDPISALDAQVGQFVFENAIKDYLSSKTVILVTHQLQLLSSVDRIIVVEQGNIVEVGTYSELMNKESSLKSILKNYRMEETDAEKKKIELEDKSKKDNNLEKNGEKAAEKDIIVDEERIVGAVKTGTYLSYIKSSGGLYYIIPVLGAAVINQLSRLFTDLWLNWWTSNKFELSTDINLKVYSGLGASQIIFAMILNMSILYGAYLSSKYYHKAALSRLLKAPMSFYDSQPIGRILNRLSKDVESVDQQLWLFIFLCIISFTGLLGIIALLTYAIWQMIGLFIPLLVIYFFILKYYQRGNRELKRLESIQRSPLYSHVSESLSGLSTIRAFKVESRFVNRQRNLMDISNVPAFLKLTAPIWVNIRIEFLATTVAFILIVLGISSAISPSLIGLALTYAIGLTGLINLLLIASSQLESEMNAVERLENYGQEVEQEAARILPTDPLSDWPSKGIISIKNLELRYNSGDQRPVISNLSIDINPGEKIGVVGRTGSGKSTLVTALFRIVEPSNGSIIIDGIDTSKMGLTTLRKGMEIITQEPVLFTGTIRDNLDVVGEFQDSDLWDVLEMIGLKQYISELQEKLDSQVSENGENLSVGQRQLLCLGRAILKKPKILIMDEATASVDTKADKLIQESIKINFKDSTVISVAHRLNTIVEFDRILVLENGILKEFESPKKLLENRDSLFYKLAEATGPNNLELLKEMANSRIKNF